MPHISCRSLSSCNHRIIILSLSFLTFSQLYFSDSWHQTKLLNQPTHSNQILNTTWYHRHRRSYCYYYSSLSSPSSSSSPLYAIVIDTFHTLFSYSPIDHCHQPFNTLQPFVSTTATCALFSTCIAPPSSILIPALYPDHRRHHHIIIIIIIIISIFNITLTSNDEQTKYPLTNTNNSSWR